jgi:hypothetical protein
MSPGEVEAAIASFIDAYNNDRLHQGICFVTPAERHDGRHEAIIAARLEGMKTAQDARRAYHRNREGITPPPPRTWLRIDLRGSSRSDPGAEG